VRHVGYMAARAGAPAFRTPAGVCDEPPGPATMLSVPRSLRSRPRGR